MKNILITLIAIMLLPCFANQASATHVLGADILYKHLTGTTYEISIIYYRSCNGVAMANPSTTSKITCVASNKSVVMDLTFKSLRDITPLCDTAKSRCNPANTGFTGDGIEAHTFTQVVNFADSKFSDLYNCGGEIIISTSHCCRNSNITTGAANANFYTYATINFDLKKEQNSSPVFTIPPIFKIPGNQTLMFALGAIDTMDFDSLSFKFAKPLSAQGTEISYSGAYAFDAPFKAYWPAKQHPYTNVNASPPIGVYLDAFTGTVITTPIKLDEVTVYVIEVTEWRKDAKGIPQIVSVTRRDAQVSTQASSVNVAPIFSFNGGHQVVKGKAGCVGFTVTDRRFIPPPPQTAQSPDTLSIQLTGNLSHLRLIIDSISYIKLHTTVIGKVCYDSVWANKKQHNFYLHIKDQACPLNNEVSVGFFKDGAYNSTLSAPELRHFTTTLYPNPAHGFVVFDNPFDSEIEIALIAMNGVVQMAKQTDTNRISLEGLASGLYTVRLMGKTGVAFSKLLVL